MNKALTLNPKHRPNIYFSFMVCMVDHDIGCGKTPLQASGA